MHQFPSAWEVGLRRYKAGFESLINSYIIIHFVDFGIIFMPYYLQEFGF